MEASAAAAAARPEPRIDKWNRPFWEACREGRLVAQRCAETGRLWLPPGPVSPYAPGAEWSWETLSGLGRVESWIFMHQRYFESFADPIPYNIIEVRLDEGPRWISNLKGADAEALCRDLRVRVTFEPPPDPDGWPLPLFEIA